jgi:proteasome accessory factor C
MSKGPESTAVRLRRLLLLLPWLMERGEATVAETAARFDVSERQLIADLERASLCGLPPYVDEMIDLYIDDGVIHMGVPRLFTRPLRLTAAEGFSLAAAGRAAMSMPGAQADGALDRALAKLEQALGATPIVAVDLQRTPFLDVVRAAIAQRQQLAVTYYTAGRDERSQRTLSPHAVFADRGDWYVIADDSLSGQQERRFRIDRFEACVPTTETFAHREVLVPDGFSFGSVEGVTPVTLLVQPIARWIEERYPVRAVRPNADGSAEIDLGVASEPWLARLLLRLGPDASVVSPGQWEDLPARAAAKVLVRYR